MSVNLFTARYQAVKPGMGVPIRTSLGTPRWRLPYSIKWAMRELMPDRSFLHSPKPQYEIAYRAKLDEAGPERLAELFRCVVDAESDSRLILLCFDDLTKPGGWCHRTMFAQWWTEETGDPVRELGPAPTTTQGELL